jgi:hypothetical protein
MCFSPGILHSGDYLNACTSLVPGFPDSESTASPGILHSGDYLNACTSLVPGFPDSESGATVLGRLSRVVQASLIFVTWLDTGVNAAPQSCTVSVQAKLSGDWDHQPS